MRERERREQKKMARKRKNKTVSLVKESRHAACYFDKEMVFMLCYRLWAFQHHCIHSQRGETGKSGFSSARERTRWSKQSVCISKYHYRTKFLPIFFTHICVVCAIVVAVIGVAVVRQRHTSMKNDLVFYAIVRACSISNAWRWKIAWDIVIYSSIALNLPHSSSFRINLSIFPISCDRWGSIKLILSLSSYCC